MKSLFLIITFFSLTSFTFGQQISRSTLTSSGDFSKNENGISLSWTMGQSFSQTIQSSHHLTEGFQQGALPKNQLDTIIDSSSHRFGFETSKEKFSVNLIAYPNPTVNTLSLRFETSTKEMAMITVSNLNGKKIFTQKVAIENGVAVPLQKIETLNAGIYFITVAKNGKIIATKDFIKVEP